MENIYEYIININPDIFMAVILTILFSLEQLFSNVKSLFKRAPHLINNIFLQLGYILLTYGLATLVVKLLDWADKEQIGLFNIASIPYYLYFVTCTKIAK